MAAGSFREVEHGDKHTFPPLSTAAPEFLDARSLLATIRSMQRMPQKPADTFRRNVSRVLDDRGMTIQDLADISEIARPNLSRILSGSENVTIERAGRIAKALKIELCDLLTANMKITQEIH